jgi:hypothetical protein
MEFGKVKDFYFLLPTILWQPRKYRYNGCYVITIQWLGFYIGIGTHKHND